MSKIKAGWCQNWCQSSFYQEDEEMHYKVKNQVNWCQLVSNCFSDKIKMIGNS